MPTLDVIVADDDPGVRDALRDLLAASGARVQVAASGWELLSLLADDEQVDLVIADVHMPMPNGVEALAMARSAGINAQFVLITGGCSETEKAVACRLHAAILLKPFTLRDIRNRLEQLARERQSVH